MKKLFSVSLVLAFCDIAVATVTNIYITDEWGQSQIVRDAVRGIDTAILYVWYTGDPIVLFDTEIGASRGGTLDQPVITAEGRQTEYDYVGAGNYLDWEISAGTDTGSLTPGLAKPLAVTLFTCVETGTTVTVSLLDIGTFGTDWQQVTPTMHGMTIYQVPEPATLLLLGLGSLATVRKRRAY